ncbi:MAG: hypothetical protein ACLSAP_10795 [Oscillospiraceae bacterium]
MNNNTIGVNINLNDKKVTESLQNIYLSSEKAISAVNELSTIFKGTNKIIDSISKSFKDIAESEKEVQKETKTLDVSFGQSVNILQGAVGGLTGLFFKDFKNIGQLLSTVTKGMGSALKEVVAAVGMCINPTAVLVGALGLLVTTIGIAVSSSDPYKKAMENLRESQEKYAESFEPMAEGAKKFREELANAESSMKNFDNSILITQENSQKLSSSLAEAQKGLTNIVQSESAQRGELTKKETDEMQRYYETIKTLSDQEMGLHSKRLEQNEGLTQAFINNYKGTADGFLQESTRFIKGAQDEAAAVKEAAEKKRDGIISNAMEMVGTSSEYTQEWYDNEVEKAYKDCELETEIANIRSTNVTKIAADEYLKRSESLQGYVSLATDANAGMEEENKRCADVLQKG